MTPLRSTRLSRVGPTDDDMCVERVEPRGQDGALRRQLVLRPVLHRHRPVQPQVETAFWQL